MSEQNDLFNPRLKLPDTEDWHLSANVQWIPIKKYGNCNVCGGTGSVGGGFKSFEEKRQCDNCHGSKIIEQVANYHTKPNELPEGLVEHLRAAWVEYFREDKVK